MTTFATAADTKAIEAEMPWADRGQARSMYEYLSRARTAHGARPAISFQLLSGPETKKLTLTWAELHAKVTQAANLFRSLGVGEKDVVAFILPNALETAVTLLGGAVAGIVNPINPLMEPEKISAILRETNAKVVVTLKAFPKTDLPQKVSEAVQFAPNVKTVLEVDLVPYLSGLKKVIVPWVRPKNPPQHTARILDFGVELARMPADKLTFTDTLEDRVAAYFHTGGTTGMPKVAQHKASGMVYNGWLGASLLFKPTDVVMCPLPLFHVFACYPILMSMIGSGAHVVFPTPQGYRGEGVFDNFWKLIERYKVTYMITVPTALAALMQRPVNADISSLRSAFSGSSALPVELYNRFKKETGIEIIEGYGLTEATCLVSINPPEGVKKIGSVGLVFPYTHVRILTSQGATEFRECAVDEVGEICISSPGVFEGSTYIQADKNRELFAEGRFLRTGDLGRIDADSYLYITGRAKDLIIRGGHNIDPQMIEEALHKHPAVALAAAVGKPDLKVGELPVVYVQLKPGQQASEDELLAHAAAHIHERAAVPKDAWIIEAIPLTAVGKTFKPALRFDAIARVYREQLADLPAVQQVEVRSDERCGQLAYIRLAAADAALEQLIGERLAGFAVGYRLEYAH